MGTLHSTTDQPRAAHSLCDFGYSLCICLHPRPLLAPATENSEQPECLQPETGGMSCETLLMLLRCEGSYKSPQML